jgi:hypothetical protein
VVGGNGLTFMGYAIEIPRVVVSKQKDIPCFVPLVAECAFRSADFSGGQPEGDAHMTTDRLASDNCPMAYGHRSVCSGGSAAHPRGFLINCRMSSARQAMQRADSLTGLG